MQPAFCGAIFHYHWKLTQKWVECLKWLNSIEPYLVLLKQPKIWPLETLFRAYKAFLGECLSKNRDFGSFCIISWPKSYLNARDCCYQTTPSKIYHNSEIIWPLDPLHCDFRPFFVNFSLFWLFFINLQHFLAFFGPESGRGVPLLDDLVPL